MHTTPEQMSLLNSFGARNAWIDPSLPDSYGLSEQLLSSGWSVSSNSWENLTSLDLNAPIEQLLLIGHGSPGKLYWQGEVVLDIDNSANLNIFADKINKYIPDGGDLLIGGCYVGSETIGNSLIYQLDQLTGLEVWASENRSGGNPGGDWVLERSSRASSPVEITGIKDWKHSLETLSNITLTSNYTSSSALTIGPNVLIGGDITISAPGITVTNPISGNNDGNVDKLTLKANSDSDITINANIAGGGINSITAQGANVTVGSNSILSTRQIAAGGDQATSASIGNSGSISLSTITGSWTGVGQFPLPGLNIAAGASTISLKPGSALYSFADNNFTAGDITINIDQETYTAVFGITVDSTKASISLDSTTLSGGKINISSSNDVLSYATSKFGTDNAGFINNFVFTPITTTIPSYLLGQILPASVGISITPAELNIKKSTITASSDIIITSSSTANASTSANTFVGSGITNNGNFAVAVGVGQSSSSIDLSQTSLSAPQGQVSISSTSINPTTTTASVTGNAWAKDDNKNNLDAWGLAVTTAITTTNSTISIDQPSNINAGKKISISSSAEPNTNNTANSTIFLNGKASVGVGVAIDNAKSEANIYGTLTAGNTNSSQSNFQLTSINSDGSFNISSGSFEDGTKVTYNVPNGGVNPFPTLVPGADYLLLLNNPSNSQQPQSYFLQPSSVILNEVAGSATQVQIPVDIQDQLQLDVNSSKNIPGVIQSFTKNAPLSFSSVSNVSNNTINIPDHGLIQGQLLVWNPGPFTATGGGLQVGGKPFAPDQPFYAIVIDSNNIKLANSPESAASKTALTIGSPSLPSNLTYTAGTTSIDLPNGIITINNHGLVNNQPILYTVPSGSSSIGGLSSQSIYYIIVINDDKFALASSQVNSSSWSTTNQTQITFTSTGSGNSNFDQAQDINLFIAEKLLPASQTLPVSSGNPSSVGVFTIPNNGFFPGQYVTYQGTSLGALTNGTGYFISPINQNEFVICSNPSDAVEGVNAITNLNNSGSGTINFLYGKPTLSFYPVEAINNDTNIISIINHGLITGDVVTYQKNLSYTNTLAQPRYNGFNSSSVDLSASTITLTGSELNQNDSIVYQAGYLGSPGAVINGLKNNTTYYIKLLSTTSDGNQTIQLLPEINGTPIQFDANQNLSGFGAMQSLTSSQSIYIGDTNIENLKSGNTYNVVRLTNNEFLLTESSSQLAAPLTLNTSPQGSYSFNTQATTSAGVDIKNTIKAKNKISVTGANGSNPKIKNLLANPALLYTLKGSLGTIFKSSTTKEELSKDADGNKLTSTSSLVAGGALAVSYVDHTSKTEISGSITASGDVSIESSISQEQQDQASSATGAGTYKNSDNTDVNSNTISVAQILDFYTNHAFTNINPTAKISSAGNVSIVTNVEYKTIYDSATSYWDSLKGKASKPSSTTTTNVSNAIQQWSNLLFGGNLGLISAYFNTFAQTKNWGGFDANGNNKTETSFAYVGIYQQFNNISLTTLKSGSSINASGGIKTNSNLTFNSLGAAGIIHLSLDLDSLGKIKDGKPLSELFSPFGNRSSNGVGASMVFQQNAHQSETIIQPGVTLTAGSGGISINATNTANPWLFAQAGGQTANFGLTGSFPFVTQSIITTAQLSGYAVASTTGALSITATTNGLRLLGSGSMMWTNSVGIGIGATIYKEQQSTRALIGLASNSVIANAGTNSGTTITSNAVSSTTLTAPTVITAASLNHSTINSTGLFSLALAGVLSTSGVTGTDDKGNPKNKEKITSSWGLGISGSEAYTSVGAYTQLSINAPSANSIISIGGKSTLANSQTAYYKSGSGSILFSGGKQQPANANAGGNGGLGLSLAFAHTLGNDAPGSGAMGIIADTTIAIPNFNSGSFDINNGASNFAPTIFTGAIGLAGNVPFKSEPNAWAVDGAGSWAQNTLGTSNTLTIGSSGIKTTLTSSTGAVNASLKSSPTIWSLAGAAALVWNGRTAVAAGVSIAQNEIDQATKLNLSNATFISTASGSGPINVTSDASNISIQSLAFAGAISSTKTSSTEPAKFDDKTTIALAGAGAGSYNTIKNNTQLNLDTAQLLTNGSAIQLTLKQQSSINADGGGAALSAAINSQSTQPTFSGSVGASISHNTITDNSSSGVSISGSSLNASSNGTAAGAISIQTLLDASLNSVSIGGALTGAYSATGASSGALAGAGSGSNSTLALKQPVKITNSTLSGSTLTLQRTVKPTIAITSGGFAAALNWAKSGNGGLNGALSVGASVSLSSASLSAPLSISSSTLTASSGALNISTVATPDLAMLSMGGALSLSAGQTPLVNGALAGAGAGATTTYSGDLSASINQSTLSATAGGLSISTIDQASIVSDAGGVAVGVALGGKYTGAVSVGASTAFNTVSLNDQHSITNSSLSSSGGDLSISVNGTNNGNNGLLKAVTLGGSAAVGATTNGQVALALSGAGAKSSNTFSPNLSVVLSGSNLTSSGGANLSGNWAGDLTAKSGAYSLGVGFSTGTAAIGASIGASLASNTITTVDGKAPSLGVSGSGLNNLTTSTGATISGGFNGNTTTQAIAGTIAIAGSTGGFALSGSGAGSQADTNITLPINANLSIGTLNGGVSLSTTDYNAITTVAGAGSLSVGVAKSVGIAVSAVAALANSSVNNTINAGLTGSGIGAGGNTNNQAVNISTNQSGAINTTAVSVAATIAGSGTFSLGATGAGSNATTSLSGSSTASLNSVAVNAGTGAVSLTASDSRSIDSDGGGYSLAVAGSPTASVAVSIGAAISSVSLSNTVASVVNGGSVSAASLYLSTTASGSISSLTAAGSLAAAGAANVGVAASGAGCGATLSSNRTLTAQAYGGSSLSIGSGGLTIYNSDTTSLSTDTYAFAISLAAGYVAVAVNISATKTSLTLGTQYNTGIGKSSDSFSAINQLAIAGTTSITTNANPSIVKADVLAVGAGAAIGLGAAVGGALSLVDITLGGAVASTLINARGSTGKFGINTTGSLTLAPKTNTVGVSAGLVGATFGASKVVLTRNTALSLTVSNSTLDMGGDVNLGLSDTFGANTTVTPVSVGVGGGAGAGAGGGVASTESSSRSLNFSNSSLKATGNITINLQRTLSQLQSQNNTVAVAAGAAGAVGIGGSDLQTTNSGNTSLSISGSTITAGGSLSVSSTYASPVQQINGTVVAASVGFYSVSVTGSYSTLTDTSNTNLQLQQSSLISGGALTATALTTGSASTQVLAVSASLGIGAGLGANIANSTFSPTTSLNIGNASYLQSGGTLTLSSQLNPVSSGASPSAGALASAVQSGGGVVSGQYSSSTATTSASTKLESDSSSTITAAGNLSLNVGGSDVALTSSPNNVSIGLLGYGGVSSTATTGSSFNVSPGGAFSSTGGSLTLNGSVQTASGGTANAVGVAGISVATNLASITNNTTLTIAPSSSANLSAASGLNITGAITSGTLAQVDAISAGVIGVGVTNATATDNSSLNISTAGNLTSSGGSIALSASRSSLNQSISAFSSTAAQTFNYNSNPGTQALSTASGGGLVGVNAATAKAVDNTNTSLSVGSAANLIAKQGTINITTTGNTTSGSSATGITVGLLVAVGVNTASTTNNSTWSSLIDGVGSLQSGGDITISASPVTNISSNASASGGGLVGSNNIFATATATPTVSAGMLSSSTGTSTEAISAGGNYQQQATLTSNSLKSSTSGTTGGGIAWTESGATSVWQPKISSLLPSDANLQAVQSINITANTADTSSTGFSAQAQGNAYGFVGAVGIKSNLTVSPSVSAGIGNNSSATSSKGSATISSTSQNKGTGSTDSFMAYTNSIVGGVIGKANSNTTGTYNPSISTSLGTNSKVQAPTGITITSQSNDNLSAGSSAGQIVLTGGFAGNSTINSSNASITTTIGSGSTLEALQGTIKVQSNPGYNLSTSAKNQVTSGFTGGQTQATTNGTINSVVNINSNTVLNASYVNVNTNLNPATISSYAQFIADWPAITDGNANATNNLNHQGSINLSGTINASSVDLLASMNAGIGSNLNSSATGYGTIKGMTIGGGAYGKGTNNSTLQSNLNLDSNSIINAQSVNINSLIGNGGYSKSGQGRWKTNVVCGIPIYGNVNNTSGSFTANGATQFNGTINAGAIAILKASDSNSTPNTTTVASNGPISYQLVSNGGVNTLVVNDVPTANAPTSTSVSFSNGSSTTPISVTSPGTYTLLSSQFTNAPYWGGSTPSSLQFNIGIYDQNQNLIAAGNSAYNAISSFSVNEQSINTNGNASTINLSPGANVPLQVSFNANTLQNAGQVMVVQMTPVGSTVNAVNATNTQTLTIPSPFQTTANSSNTLTALGFQQQLQVNATAINSGNITIPSTGGSLISGSNWNKTGTAPFPIINQASSSQNILIQQANLPKGTLDTYYPVFTPPVGTTVNSFTVVEGSAGLLSSAQPGSSSNQINFAFVPSQNGSYDLNLANGNLNNVTGWSVVSSANLTNPSTQAAPAISYTFTTPSLVGTYQFTPVNNDTTALNSLSISGGSLTPNTLLNPSGTANLSLAANTTYTLTASAASGQNLTPANVLVNWQAPSQNLNTAGNSGQNLVAGTTYTYTLSGSDLTTSTGSPAINISWSTSSGAVTTLPTSPPTAGSSLAGVTLGSSSSTTSYLFKINSNKPLPSTSNISWYLPSSSIYQATYTYTGTGTAPISYTPSGGTATPFQSGTDYSFIYNSNNSITIGIANSNGGFTPYTVTAPGSATNGSYGWFTSISQQQAGLTSPIWTGGAITGFQAFVGDNFSTNFNSSSFSGNTAVSTNSLNNNLLTVQVPASQPYSNPQNLRLFLDSFTPSSTLPSGTVLSGTPTTASLVKTPAAPSGLSSPVSSQSGTTWGISFTPPVNGTYYTGFTTTNTPANTSFSVTQGGTTTNLDPAGNTGVTLSSGSPALYTISTTSGNSIPEPALTWYLPGVSWSATSTYNAAQPSPANDGLNRYFIGLNQSSSSLFNNLVSNNQILAANGSISLAMTSGTSYPISALSTYGTTIADANQALSASSLSLLWHLQSFPTYSAEPASLANKSVSNLPPIQTTINQTGTSTLRGSGSVNSVAGVGFVAISNISQSQLQVASINTQTSNASLSAKIGTSSVQIPYTFTGNGSTISFTDKPARTNPLVIINNSTTNSTFTGPINAAAGSVIITNPAGSQTWQATAASTSGSLSLSSYGSIELQETAAASITGVNNNSITLSNSIGSNTNQPLMLGFPSDAANAFKHDGLSSGALYNATTGSSSGVVLTPLTGQNASSTANPADVGLQIFTGAQLIASGAAEVSSGQGINIAGAAKLQAANLNLYLGTATFQNNPNNPVLQTGTSSSINGSLVSTATIQINGSNPSNTQNTFIGADILSLGRILPNQTLDVQLLGGIDTVKIGMLPYTSNSKGISRWLNGSVTLGALNTSSYNGPTSQNGWEFNKLEFNNSLDTSTTSGSINSSQILGLGMGDSSIINYNNAGTTNAGFTEQMFSMGSGSDTLNFNGNLNYTSSFISSHEGNDNINLTNWNNSAGAQIKLMAGNGDDDITINQTLINYQTLINSNSPNPIPNIFLGDGNNSLRPSTGSTSINVDLEIHAENGNNSITGSINNDSIIMGGGNNNINSLSGNDAIRTKDGDNTINFELGNKDVYLGNGNNTVMNTYTALTPPAQPFLQNVRAGWGDDIIDLSSPNIVSNIFTGSGTNYARVTNANKNTIITSLGSTYVQGGSGADIYALGPGDQTLVTTGGFDRISTGPGNQRLELKSSPITNSINLEFKPGSTVLAGNLSGNQINIAGPGKSIINLVNESLLKQIIKLGTGNTLLKVVNTHSSTPMNEIFASTGSTTVASGSQVEIIPTSPNASIVYSSDSDSNPITDESFTNNPLWKPPASLWNRLTTFLKLTLS